MLGGQGCETSRWRCSALLVLDPFLSRSVGFALSVLASGAIVWWARSWSVIMGRWLPVVVAESVSVPLAAHLATLPLVAAISGRVSLSGLVANALAGPFVGPATVLGLGAAGLSLVSPAAASVCGLGAAWSAQVIIWVAHYGSLLPGSSWPWPTTPAALAWLSTAALAGGLAVAGVLARPWLALLLAAAMVVGMLGPPALPGWPPRGWVLVACDVGQGDGLVLRAGRHAAIVVDAGPDPVAMRRCLDQLEVEAVPLLVLTHFHADHVDGLEGVLTGRSVGQIWVSRAGFTGAGGAGGAARCRGAGHPGDLTTGREPGPCRRGGAGGVGSGRRAGSGCRRSPRSRTTAAWC